MSVASDYRAYAEELARKYKLKYFVPQIQQESGFDPNARSGAGAIGIAQIMPDTARGWGVDPNDPRAALEAAARNMAKYRDEYGSERAALIAYNAGPARVGLPFNQLPKETQDYIRIITGGGANQGSSSAPASLSRTSIASMYGNATGATMDAPQQPSVFDVIRQYREATSGEPSPILDMAARFSMPSPTPTAPTSPTAMMDPTGASDLPVVGGAGQRGKVKIVGGNPGRLKSGVVSFAEQLAGVLGRPLTVDSGASHSKYTVNGNVSEHYTGNATDIPMSGEQLTHAGQQALILAGMDPAEARKQKGGLFNVFRKDGTRYQIIFNTMEGGNHYNHLHVGWRPGKGK